MRLNELHGYFGFSTPSNPFPLLRGLGGLMLDRDQVKTFNAGLNRISAFQEGQTNESFWQQISRAANNSWYAAISFISAEHLGEAKRLLKGMNNGLALSIIATVGTLLSGILAAARVGRCATLPIMGVFAGVALIGLGVTAYNTYRLTELTKRSRNTSFLGSVFS